LFTFRGLKSAVAQSLLPGRRLAFREHTSPRRYAVATSGSLGAGTCCELWAIHSDAKTGLGEILAGEDDPIRQTSVVLRRRTMGRSDDHSGEHR
jgi:hypothetical protein